MCAPLRAWWPLRHSRLPTQPGNIMGRNDKLNKYGKICECLIMQYGKEALQKIDRTRRHTDLARWRHEDEYPSGGIAEDDDELEAQDDTTARNVEDEPDLEANAMAQDTARNFQPATKLMQQVRTSNSSFPVDRRINQKGSKKGAGSTARSAMKDSRSSHRDYQADMLW